MLRCSMSTSGRTRRCRFEELARRGVPFVFATGYGEDGLVRGFDTPVVRKPYDRASLVAAIHRAIGRGAGTT